MSSSRRTYTTEFKLQAVQMLTQQGLSPGEVAGRLGISTDRLRKWKKTLSQPGALTARPSQPNALEAEVISLRAENARLKMEREILKKAATFFAKESR
jgi:transposase